MKVSVVIPTRGDVDMRPILDSLRDFDEVLVWDNSKREDLGVYGRYAMIEEARNDLIVTQDDDVIVGDPQTIVDTWLAGSNFSVAREPLSGAASWPSHVHPRGSEVVVCNMPPEFRHDFYKEHALVGFGACFHRDAPGRAFSFFDQHENGRTRWTGDWVTRTSDVIFTALSPRVLVDVPVTSLPYASDPGRMWTTPGHQQERERMLALVRQVRGA